MTDPLDLATVETYLLRHEAEIAKARLAADGIRSMIQADDEGGLNPGFFDDYRIRLLVNRENLVEAAEVLANGIDPGPDETIVANSDHLEAFAAHAQFCLPNEACGLLAFDAARRLRFVYCLTNRDASPHRYTVDPVEHYRAIQHAERNGWEVAGAFHSHPRGRARPSKTDIEAAGDPEWIHVIIGLASGAERNVRAFRVVGGSAREIPLAVL